MAKTIITGTYLTLGGVDYAAQITEAGLEIDAPAQEVTNMGSGGWAERIGGIKSGNLTVAFAKDSDLSGLDAAMFAALGTSLAFVLKRTSAATGATNPSYSGSVLISKWTPIAGAVGSVFGGSYTFETTGAVTRATA